MEQEDRSKLMADDYFKKNYVKKLSEHNDWYEKHKQEEEEDFDIKHTIDTYGKIGIEDTNTNRKE